MKTLIALEEFLVPAPSSPLLQHTCDVKSDDALSNKKTLPSNITENVAEEPGGVYQLVKLEPHKN
jgi:hypothetical protein